MRIRLLAFFIVPLFCGCTQLQLLPYLDQALLLKEFGKEKDAQHKYIQGVDERFDQLVKAIQSSDIKNYKTERDIVQAFGPPILAETVNVDGKSLRKCLYRYVIQLKGPQKVYVYYNEQGQLIRFELL